MGTSSGFASVDVMANFPHASVKTVLSHLLAAEDFLKISLPQSSTCQDS